LRAASPLGALKVLISSSGILATIATRLTGARQRPVRVLLFDKSESDNWLVPWHQDRTIAVAARCETQGFGPWTQKGGQDHVEPPLNLLARMVTLRLFVDDCGSDAGPLKVAVGSHRLGRVEASKASVLAKTSAIVEATGRAGDVLAMRPLLIHASDKSSSASRRRVVHVDFSPDELPAPLQWALQ
jgi:ectoine hydroxylase-related dioxygenase (phytanoyl-CoA dioxygenase family)